MSPFAKILARVESQTARLGGKLASHGQQLTAKCRAEPERATVWLRCSASALQAALDSGMDGDEETVLAARRDGVTALCLAVAIATYEQALGEVVALQAREDVRHG